MYRGTIDIGFGSEFSQARTLTWRHDGLIILPNPAPTLLTIRIGKYSSRSYEHRLAGQLPHHWLWFTAYINPNSSVLEAVPNRELLIGNLIYTIEGLTTKVGSISRYYVYLWATRIHDNQEPVFQLYPWVG